MGNERGLLDSCTLPTNRVFACTCDGNNTGEEEEHSGLAGVEITIKYLKATLMDVSTTGPAVRCGDEKNAY